MSGMNPGFAAYLAKKKAGNATAKKAPVVVKKGKQPINPTLKANATNAAIQQRAQQY